MGTVDLGALPPPEPRSPASPNETAAPPEAPHERRKRRVELAGAIIIGIAAVLTALATYQGSQADGEVQKMSTKGVSLTLQATDLYNYADAERAKERDWFFGYITAETNGQEDTADLLIRAMPDEVWNLTDEWFEQNQDPLLDTDSLIDDPFTVNDDGTPGFDAYLDLQSFQIESIASSVQEDGNCALFDSSVADIRGDNYGISTVILAIALVVGGIAAILKGAAAQIIVLSTSVIALIIGASVLVVAGDADDARMTAATEFFRDDAGGELTPSAALEMADTFCPEKK